MESRDHISGQAYQWFPFKPISTLTLGEPCGMWHMFDGRAVMVFKFVTGQLQCLFLPGSTRGALFMPTGVVREWLLCWKKNNVLLPDGELQRNEVLRVGPFQFGHGLYALTDELPRS